MPWTTGQIVVETESALMVGGHTEPPPFLDAGAARRTSVHGAHEPVIPGSAVRGMLREALVRWLGARGEAPPEPWVTAEEPPDGPLARLFGVPGANRPGLEDDAPRREARQGLRIDDAIWRAGPRDLGLRTGVGVDRYTGHAAEGRLYQREVAEVRGAHFVAPFEGDVAPEDLALLVEAAALADGLGNSRSRGLGEIRVRLEVDPPGVPRPRSVTVGSLAEDVEIATLTVTAETDLHLGDVPDRTSLRETLGFIPGSAIRGALVWAAVDAGLRDASGFRELAESAGFSDLWPAPGWPEPRTLVGCEAPGHPEVLVDEILADSLRLRVLEHGGAPSAWKCSHCGTPLRPKSKIPAVLTRMVTRLALDPKTRSAAPGMLHTRQQIVAGTVFSGTASGLGQAVRELLARLDRPVRVGGLRSRGLGRVRVEVGPFLSSEPKNAADRFDRRARKIVPDALAAALGLPGQGWLQLVARTPLRLPEAAKPADAGRFLAKALLPPGAQCVGSHQRTGFRSGWRDRSWAGGVARAEPVWWVICPGSTWLFRLPCPATDPAVVDALTRGATAGVGDLRELGLGRVGPALTPHPLTPEAR